MSGHSKSSPLPTYFAVFIALLVGTGLTVFAATLDLGSFNAPVALTIATVKATLVALICSVGIAAFNFRPKISETLPCFAVSTTACAVVTDDTVAVNAALVAFAGTVTVAGTLTAALLLARLTLNPPLGAAALSFTVQASVPDPVIDPLPQETALNVAAVAIPVPVRLITALPLVEELLVTVS